MRERARDGRRGGEVGVPLRGVVVDVAACVEPFRQRVERAPDGCELSQLQLPGEHLRPRRADVERSLRSVACTYGDVLAVELAREEDGVGGHTASERWDERRGGCGGGLACDAVHASDVGAEQPAPCWDTGEQLSVNADGDDVRERRWPCLRLGGGGGVAFALRRGWWRVWLRLRARRRLWRGRRRWFQRVPTPVEGVADALGQRAYWLH